MDYIGPRGVSLDEWNGWSDLAQQSALAWAAREQDACPQGHHREMWDPESGGDLLERVRPRARVCPACELLQRTAEDSGDPYPGEYRVWEPFGSELPGEDDDEEDAEGEEQDS